jgi:Ca2+/Na+ antiporter
MALTQTAQHQADRPRETFLHVVARDFKWALRAACLLLLIATVVFMTTIFPLAIPTVILLLLCYALLVIAESVEHRTEHATSTADQTPGAEAPSADSPAAPEAQRRQQRTTTIERRVTRISLEVLGGALVLAAGLGAAVFHWTVLPIAGLVLLGYIILVTAPVWLAWMEDDVEEAVKPHRRPLS